MVSVKRLSLLIFVFFVLFAESFAADVQGGGATANAVAWWITPLLLFAFTFVLGIVAVMGGIGGGVLFVPLVSGFSTMHLDFVRGTALCMALACAVSASPPLLRSGMVNLRLAMPLGIVASISAVIGANIGLMLPQQVVNIALGLTILGISFVMAKSKQSDLPDSGPPDTLSCALRMHGVFFDEKTNEEISWQVHRTPQALVLFFLIGMLAGMFGLGAGWANVPVINLVMGAPLKVAVATSTFILSIVDTSAAWIYINHGAVLALATVPAVIGIMLGSSIGVKLLRRTHASVIRKMVILLLFISGARTLLKGLGIWN